MVDRDKWIHASVSFLLVVIVFGVLWKIQSTPINDDDGDDDNDDDNDDHTTTRKMMFVMGVAVLLSFGIGLVKEAVDATIPIHDGTPDPQDMLANFAGVIAGGIITWVFMSIRRTRTRTRSSNDDIS